MKYKCWVLMWWFLLVSGWANHNVIGPFGSKLQCDQYREAIAAHRNVYVYDCWSDNPKENK